MTTRRPLVLVSGSLSELPQGDTVVGANPSLLPNPSGLLLEGSKLGIDGVALVSGQAAQTTANTALSSGNAALSVGVAALASGTAALSSGNAALSLGTTALASGNAALAAFSYNYTLSSGNRTIATRERTTVLTSGVIITLPASVTTGAEVAVGNASGITTTVVSGNGARIMQLAENMTIDVANVNVSLVYVNATLGWRIY
jgi:hypothetical protein